MSDQIVQQEWCELSSLADAILATVQQTDTVPFDVGCEDDEIYWEVAYTFSKVWPDDTAAVLLAEWRVERYGL